MATYNGVPLIEYRYSDPSKEAGRVYFQEVSWNLKSGVQVVWPLSPTPTPIETLIITAQILNEDGKLVPFEGLQSSVEIYTQNNQVICNVLDDSYIGRQIKLVLLVTHLKEVVIPMTLEELEEQTARELAAQETSNEG